VVLALETLQREAGAQNKSLRDHSAHLVVHGVLHLLGFDHEEAAQAALMEEREVQLLATLNNADPYAEEAEAPPVDRGHLESEGKIFRSGEQATRPGCPGGPAPRSRKASHAAPARNGKLRA